MGRTWIDLPHHCESSGVSVGKHSVGSCISLHAEYSPLLARMVAIRHALVQ